MEMAPVSVQEATHLQLTSGVPPPLLPVDPRIVIQSLFNPPEAKPLSPQFQFNTFHLYRIRGNIYLATMASRLFGRCGNSIYGQVNRQELN